MGDVTMECPHTGEQVRTGVETDAESFTRRKYCRRPFRCQCGHFHVLDARKATLVSRDDGKRPIVSQLRRA
jgi:hypothetical protein